jgi:hypothetical protein
MRLKDTMELIVLLVSLSCLFSEVCLAQDPADADTVSLPNVSGEIGDLVSVPVLLYNDEELVSVVIPLLLNGYSGWLRLDSVSYVGSRLADPAVLDDRQVYVFGTDQFTVDSLLISLSVSSGDNLPAGTGKLCDLWFTLHFGGEVLLDSLPDSPEGGLVLTDASQASFVPQFSSGLIDISCNYLVGDVNEDDHLDLGDIIMHQKMWFYDFPLGDYPISDHYGRADVNCDRRLDMRDLNQLIYYIFKSGVPPCTCGTINSSLYNDPGTPDTVWVENKTMVAGISSPICIGIINDEPVAGMALSLEIDGSAVLDWDWEIHPIQTERIDSAGWLFAQGEHSDGVNPETLHFDGFQYNDLSIPLLPGSGAVCCPHFIPQSAGTATFSLTSWIGPGESMLVTEDHEAILPTIYGGNITVLPYLAGDPNHDGMIDVADVIYLINYLFLSGSEPDPYESGDANGDGQVDIGDVVYLANYLFLGGAPPYHPVGFFLGYEGCKEFQRGAVLDGTPPDQDCMEYQYDGQSLLLLKHVNAGFNCCPEIAADISIEDNLITIEEIELSGDCDCICLFDMDYEIRDLPPGEYTITVVEPYVPEGEQVLEFTVDLVSSPAGSFCVYRDYYPWGVWE